MLDINKYFDIAIEKNASDLHLVAGSVPSIRITGDLMKISDEVLDAEELKAAVYILLDEKKELLKRIEDRDEIDLSLDHNNFRFRINLHYQEGKIGLAARVIKKEIPQPEDLDFDETIYKLTHLTDGLILVTGPSGSGKSTTLAAMINIINKERRSHIITIEDPIEYMFEDRLSIIEQRELNIDTKSFAEALKHALRQDPNIIMVGEMRDPETISAAITAAETGHLVLSTLHTWTAAETIQRIVDAFPSHHQMQVANQLATNLRAVIAQQLLERVGGGLVVAREIMINTQAIATLIKRNQMSQINSAIQTGQKDGMVTMNKYIDRLHQKGIISESVARNRKRDLETQAVYY